MELGVSVLIQIDCEKLSSEMSTFSMVLEHKFSLGLISLLTL